MGCFRGLSRGILIFTNILFMLLGALLVGIGGYMVNAPDLNAFSHDTVPGAMIISGTLIILIALLGCCGAQKESRVFLCPYATVVFFSLLAQLLLTGFLFHLRGSLLNLSESGYDLARLNSDDQYIFRQVQHRFNHVYQKCDPRVDYFSTIAKHTLQVRCKNPKYQWFVDFARQVCLISPEDIREGSEFMKCAHHEFTSSFISEQAVFCSCEAKLVAWMKDQSTLIAVICAGIGLFEVVLVLISCYLMKTRQMRRGYMELRMPIKHQSYGTSQPPYYHQEERYNQPISLQTHRDPYSRGGATASVPSAPPSTSTNCVNYGSNNNGNHESLPFAKVVKYNQQQNPSGK